MGVTSQRLREFGGLKLDEEINLHRPEGLLVVKVRRIGPAGILVRGFASLLLWDEEGTNWSRVPRRVS